MEKGKLKNKIGLGLLSFIVTTQVMADDRLIFGEDNRLDIYQVQNEDHLKWAQSTAIIADNVDITPLDALNLNLKTRPYKNSVHAFYPLCAEEPFYNQVLGGNCSGFLVGKDIFVTAGHCIDQSDCGSRSIVFDYNVSVEGELGPKIVKKSNVYKCKEIIGHQLNETTLNDFAVIRLDREVVGREPLKFRTSDKVEDGQELVMIGHPVGLPTKVADGAQVRINDNSVFFSSNTDSYGGNSGSAVINADTGEVEGILVRGAADFVKAPGRSCMLSNRQPDSAGAEDITRATEFAKFVPNAEQPVQEQLIDLQMLSAIAIPDNVVAGISHKFNVAEAKSIVSAKLIVDISHTYVGDLKVTLISPNGQSLILHNRAGGSGDDIKKTYELSSLVGVSAQGAWLVKIADLAGRDVGKVNSLKLQLSVK